MASLSHFHKTVAAELGHKSYAPFLRAIQKAAPNAEIYLVGGAVRDFLMKRPTKDLDFVVRNVSLSRLITALRPLGKTNLVGKKFGVIKFTPKNAATDSEAIDIALPREEYSVGNTGHYRDFAITFDPTIPIDADLSRRDFTINAIAYNVATRELVDPFGGCADIAARTIRAVGTPQRRFEEDYSRMMRALRFACSLDFSLEQKTGRAIKALSHHLNDIIALPESIDASGDPLRAIPVETIAREWIKAFVAAPVKAFDLFYEYGIFKTLCPEFLAMKKVPQPTEWHAEGDVWAHTRLALESLSSRAFKKECGADAVTPELVIAVLFHDIGKPPTLKTPKRDGTDRIRFDGHDRVGAGITRRILESLRFSAAPEFHIDPDRIHWLVARHLIAVTSDVSQMKATTIEKYFFNDAVPGNALLCLMVADALGCKRKDGGSTLGAYRALQKRISAVAPLAKNRRVLPKALINGDDCIRTLGFAPGRIIGFVLEHVREAQLSHDIKTKRQALAYARTIAKNFHDPARDEYPPR